MYYYLLRACYIAYPLDKCVTFIHRGTYIEQGLFYSEYRIFFENPVMYKMLEINTICIYITQGHECMNML